MAKNWILKPQIPEDYPELSKNRLVNQLLFNRGFLDSKKASEFLHPRYEDMFSPYKFQDMKKAVDRVWDALEKKEKILVYGDYDADGITATALLVQAFAHLGVEVDKYVPDRFSEGYGLNLSAFEGFVGQGVNLVITVDCGTNSVDVADFCKENGIDLIITDHHEITGVRPESFALINPKNPDDDVPDREVTGVGVAYKLAKAILDEKYKVAKIKGIPETEYIENWDKWLLDLAAIGTVADCHSLMGDNRILVNFGLKVMAKTKWPGLRALLNLAGAPGKQGFDSQLIGFKLAPRINAAGRLEHGSSALDLLLAKDQETADASAIELDKINQRRQEITERLVSEAREKIISIQDRKILVVSHKDWHRGVVGLVASRLASEFMKPVVVLEEGEEESVGSARSIGSFNIVEALKFSSQHLVKFGGHKQAAGLSLKTSQFELFYKSILKYAEDNASGDSESEEGLELEASLEKSDLSLDTFDIVEQLEPFGVENPKPKFLLSKANVENLRLVGANQKHLQMQLLKDGFSVGAIGFNMGRFYATIKPGDTVDIACEMLADSWNGYRNFKLRILDIKV